MAIKVGAELVVLGVLAEHYRMTYFGSSISWLSRVKDRGDGSVEITQGLVNNMKCTEAESRAENRRLP